MPALAFNAYLSENPFALSIFPHRETVANENDCDMPMAITVSLTVTTKCFGRSSSTNYFYILVLSLLMILFTKENILNRGQVLKILQPATFLTDDKCRSF